MSVESKIKFRAYAFIVAVFVVLAFIFGILYTLWVALLAFLLWKAFQWIKMLRFWNNESLLNRQLIEYITAQLNEGDRSTNLWVKSLTLPEMKDFALKYRVELMARNAIIEKDSTNLIEGWTSWGASRLEEYVLQLSGEELANDIGSEEHQMPFGMVMVMRAAFEILVAEHALSLLKVQNPREAISREMLSKQLVKLNASQTEGTPGEKMLAAFNAESWVTATGLLAKALGEKGPERN